MNLLLCIAIVSNSEHCLYCRSDGEYCYPTRAAQDLALALAPLLAAQVALLSQQASANPASQQQGPQQQARAITPDQAYSLASKLTPLLHQALRNAHLKKISAASEVGAGITFEDSSSAVHEQALQAALAEALLDDAPAVPQEKHRRALEAAIAAILLADHTVTSAHSDIDAKASQEVSPTSTTIRRAAAPSAQLEECLHDWIGNYSRCHFNYS